MKVALVHEFLTQLGGAEKVLECFHEMFPEAPVFTLIYDEGKTEKRFAAWDVRPSFLQAIAKFVPYKWLLPLMPAAISSFDFGSYDVILSDSSAFAKVAKAVKPGVHICYCHTPTRYVWQDKGEYIASLPYPKFVKKLTRVYIEQFLKKWDYRAAQGPDFFIANSRTVQERIKNYYQRDSEVIYPPVDAEFFSPLPNPPHPAEGEARQGRQGEGNKKRNSSPRSGGGEVGGSYYLTASRLEPYKKIDLVIEAFNRLGLPLKVAGAGTQAQSLKRKAQNNIEFLGRVSDEELRNLYQGAKAFIFPALEDAGIMVLESLACGTPVIGLNRGGTAEFVRHGENGVLFEEQTVEDIIAAAKRFDFLKFNSGKLRESVLLYDKQNFKKKILEFISNVFARSETTKQTKEEIASLRSQ